MQLSDGPDAETIGFVGKHGVRLNGRACGPAGGMPVILSHGGGQTRQAWGSSAMLLAQAGFRAVSLDLRGHGESEWTTTGDYPVDDYADDLRAVMAALARPAILVGASLGGIASLLAIGEPPGAAVAGLCLVDVSPHLMADGVAGILGFMRGTKDGFSAVEEAADAIAAYLPHRPRPTDLGGLAKNLRRHNDGRFYWHWDPRTIDQPLDPATMNPRLEAAAARVHVSTLLLRGQHSELVSHAAAGAFMVRFARGQLVEIAGARHMVAGDRNDLFGRALLDFVVSVATPTDQRSGAPHARQ